MESGRRERQPLCVRVRDDADLSKDCSGGEGKV